MGYEAPGLCAAPSHSGTCPWYSFFLRSSASTRASFVRTSGGTLGCISAGNGSISTAKQAPPLLAPAPKNCHETSRHVPRPISDHAPTGLFVPLVLVPVVSVDFGRSDEEGSARLHPERTPNTIAQTTADALIKRELTGVACRFCSERASSWDSRALGS